MEQEANLLDVARDLSIEDEFFNGILPHEIAKKYGVTTEYVVAIWDEIASLLIVPEGS